MQFINQGLCQIMKYLSTLFRTLLIVANIVIILMLLLGFALIHDYGYDLILCETMSSLALILGWNSYILLCKAFFFEGNIYTVMHISELIHILLIEMLSSFWLLLAAVQLTFTLCSIPSSEYVVYSGATLFCLLMYVCYILFPFFCPYRVTTNLLRST